MYRIRYSKSQKIFDGLSLSSQHNLLAQHYIKGDSLPKPDELQANQESVYFDLEKVAYFSENAEEYGRLIEFLKGKNKDYEPLHGEGRVVCDYIVELCLSEHCGNLETFFIISGYHNFLTNDEVLVRKDYYTPHEFLTHEKVTSLEKEIIACLKKEGRGAEYTALSHERYSEIDYFILNATDRMQAIQTLKEKKQFTQYILPLLTIIAEVNHSERIVTIATFGNKNKRIKHSLHQVMGKTLFGKEDIKYYPPKNTVFDANGAFWLICRDKYIEFIPPEDSKLTGLYPNRVELTGKHYPFNEMILKVGKAITISQHQELLCSSYLYRQLKDTLQMHGEKAGNKMNFRSFECVKFGFIAVTQDNAGEERAEKLYIASDGSSNISASPYRDEIEAMLRSLGLMHDAKVEKQSCVIDVLQRLIEEMISQEDKHYSFGPEEINELSIDSIKSLIAQGYINVVKAQARRRCGNCGYEFVSRMPEVPCEKCHEVISDPPDTYAISLRSMMQGLQNSLQDNNDYCNEIDGVLYRIIADVGSFFVFTGNENDHDAVIERVKNYPLERYIFCINQDNFQDAASHNHPLMNCFSASKAGKIKFKLPVTASRGKKLAGSKGGIKTKRNNKFLEFREDAEKRFDEMRSDFPYKARKVIIIEMAEYYLKHRPRCWSEKPESGLCETILNYLKQTALVGIK